MKNQFYIRNSTNQKVPDDHLHLVNSKILQAFPPSDSLRQRLKDTRGLTDNQIDMFIANPIDRASVVGKVLSTGGVQPDDLLYVPGFYLDEESGGTGEDAIKFKTYLNTDCVIAVRNETGKVVALQARLKATDSSPRYLWYSSKGRPGGATSGAPMGVVPGKRCRMARQDLRIAVCEGFFKAAAIARTLDVDYAVFSSGIQNTSPFSKLVRRLARRKPFSLLIVPDMDFLTNREVMKAYAKLTGGAMQLTKDVSVLAWPVRFGKGFDVMLAAGGLAHWRMRPGAKLRDALHKEATRLGSPTLMDYIENCFY